MFASIFNAVLGARIHAWLSEFSLLALALVFAAAAILLLSIDPAGIERWPIIGRFVAGAKLTIAYVLLALAIGTGCLFLGERMGGALEREVCRAKIEAIADANRAAIDKALKDERERTKLQTESVLADLDKTAREKAEADATSTRLREIIARMEAADPKAAAAPLPPLIRQAIRGARGR